MRSFVIGFLVVALLDLAGGCSRRPRREGSSTDPEVRRFPAPQVSDAGVPVRDAGMARPTLVDAGSVGAMALPTESEEITAERVIKGRWCDFDVGDGRADDCRWWGAFEVDLRDPKLKRLPVLECRCGHRGI